MPAPALGERDQAAAVDGSVVLHDGEDERQGGSCVRFAARRRRSTTSDEFFEVRDERRRVRGSRAQAYVREWFGTGRGMWQPLEPVPVGGGLRRGERGEYELCWRVQRDGLNDQATSGPQQAVAASSETDRAVLAGRGDYRNRVDVRERRDGGSQLRCECRFAVASVRQVDGRSGRQRRGGQSQFAEAGGVGTSGPQQRSARADRVGTVEQAWVFTAAAGGLAIDGGARRGDELGEGGAETGGLGLVVLACGDPVLEGVSDAHQWAESDEHERGGAVRREVEHAAEQERREERDDGDPRGLRGRWRLWRLKLFALVDWAQAGWTVEPVRVAEH